MFGRKKSKSDNKNTFQIRDNGQVNKFKSKYFGIFVKDNSPTKSLESKRKEESNIWEVVVKEKKENVSQKEQPKKIDEQISKKGVVKPKEIFTSQVKTDISTKKVVEVPEQKPKIEEKPQVKDVEGKKLPVKNKQELEPVSEEKDFLLDNENKELEKQEKILELMVAREFETLLKNNRFELKKLSTELEFIKKEADSLYEVKTAEEAIGEIERLLDRLQKIKDELSVIEDSYDLEKVFKLGDNYFAKLFDDYKASVKEQTVIERKVSDLKKDEEYTSLIKKILEFEKLEEKLQQTLDEKKDELQNRDDKFSLMKRDFTSLEEANDKLEKIVKESEDELKAITDKVDESVDVIKRTEVRFRYTIGALAKALFLYRLLKKNPLHKANAMSAVETLATLSLIRSLLTPQEEKKRIIEYHYTNYHKLIENAISDIDFTFVLLKEGLSQVQEMKNLFEKEFSKYENLLPEYKNLFYSLYLVEKELLERQDNMERIKKEMSIQLDKNDEKVLRYENIEERIVS